MLVTVALCQSAIQFHRVFVLHNLTIISFVAGSCIRVKDDCPPMKQIEDQTREVDCDHLVRRTSEKDCPPIKQLEEQRSRTECAQTSHSTIEDCPKLTAADPPQKKDECPPPRKPPMTPPRQVAPTCPPITEPPDGGDSGSSKKWLWGLLAVFLGGALVRDLSKCNNRCCSTNRHT